MALQSYRIKENMKAPYVVATGNSRNPTRVEYKQFRKGELINGEMKHANNKPALVLVKGVIPIPIWNIEAVVTKEINATPEATSNADAAQKKEAPKKIEIKSNKHLYLHAAVIGIVLGVAGAIVAEKKVWVPANPKNKLYGALIGMGSAIYLTYAFKDYFTQVKVPKQAIE